LAPTAYQTMACGARVEAATPAACVELPAARAQALQQAGSAALLVDVREPYEQQLGQAPGMDEGASSQAVPLSGLLNALPQWLALPADTPVVFYCRSGNRSAQAAHALRRLGHHQAFSVAGGLALWPERAPASVSAVFQEQIVDRF
ncbi:rhodanese-like domain-containing protein, partial [Comamonas sp.]